MLKRLELVGFKSFADKTDFAFSPGITCVIGPNGSGKSNVVDGVRWVLGEQSAKSLRGGEMTDVIFNGSAGRRSLGLAEVTMTFDNSRRVLATALDEVQITRRVYRSGESEYLINHQPCRLKDVKDLFLGSGAGTDAYCVIEQGRVDVLLQASTRERRTIFEEAAGISRFKAKKTETLRRLERVDQNLQRLRDILDEVEKQLRSVKLQAAKAQRHQEYSGRLRELRVALGLQDYRRLSGQLETEQTELERQRAGLREQTEQADAWERELHQLEEGLAGLDVAVREQETELAAARQQIAAGTATLAREWSLAGEVEQDLAQTRQRLADLARHVTDLAGTAERAAGEWQRAEEDCAGRRQAVSELEDLLHATERRLVELHEQGERAKNEHIDRMRQAALLQNDAISYKAQVDNLTRERNRLQLRGEQAAEHLASLDLELQDLTAAEEQAQARLGAARQGLADLRQERDRLRQLGDETAQRAADLRARRSGLVSRVEVLEGLERSHEGLGTGPREVFALLEQPDPGPWRTVRGTVADFLTVRRDFAPLIDLALGERSQHFLVRALHELGEALRRHGQPFSGRVSFLPLDGPAPAAPAGGPLPAPTAALTRLAGPGLPEHPGLIAPAEQVVRCDDPQLAGLPTRLLGGTLIVRDLATARAVVARGLGYRCITLHGELLEADGTLTVGTHHAEAGILSRKSELRELREQVVALDRDLAELDRDLADLRERTALLDGRVENARTEVDVLAEQAADLRSRIGQHRQRRAGLHEEVEVNRTEMTGLEQDIDRLTAAWRQARAEVARAEAEVQELQTRLADADREGREREAERQLRQQQATDARVLLAQVEERRSALRARHEQVEADLRQRRQEHEQADHRLHAARARLDENQRTLLHTSAALAGWYLRKEAAERLLAERERERAGLRQRRQELNEQTQTGRASWRERQEQAHTRELAVTDLRHRLDTLCARLYEDYQLDLAALYQEFTTKAQRTQREDKGEEGAPVQVGEAPVDSSLSSSLCSLCLCGESLDAEAANEEIAELRRKLGRLGSVNLEAIQELSDLEARAGALQIQYDDLTAARRSLEEIIATINGDSRRLFAETFATIRTNFQELFRKLFAGGMADVVLEDESDVLESGIEVIARPPGKELRSISLMSGGEKTMTAVALLLAIFRSKPSPFCILDEVDAALDEANVGRFTAVLRDFTDRSQFIIISHSKRTMACADVLYGVTMQESGVSRRLAVRFEDWPDDERPSAEAS